jgi:hypothetical protein
MTSSPSAFMSHHADRPSGSPVPAVRAAGSSVPTATGRKTLVHGVVWAHQAITGVSRPSSATMAAAVAPVAGSGCMQTDQPSGSPSFRPGRWTVPPS